MNSKLMNVNNYFQENLKIVICCVLEVILGLLGPLEALITQNFKIFPIQYHKQNIVKLQFLTTLGVTLGFWGSPGSPK